MKTLKTLTAALLMLVSVSTFAADGKKNEKFEMNYALKTYIEAVTHGKISTLSEVLDSEVKLTTTRGEKIINQSRVELLKRLKLNENIIQNCETQVNIVESNPTLTVVKVSMKYINFTKVDYISLANTTKGWKITSISSSFN